MSPHRCRYSISARSALSAACVVKRGAWQAWGMVRFGGTQALFSPRRDAGGDWPRQSIPLALARGGACQGRASFDGLASRMVRGGAISRGCGNVGARPLLNATPERALIGATPDSGPTHQSNSSPVVGIRPGLARSPRTSLGVAQQRAHFESAGFDACSGPVLPMSASGRFRLTVRPPARARLSATSCPQGTTGAQ